MFSKCFVYLGIFILKEHILTFVRDDPTVLQVLDLRNNNEKGLIRALFVIPEGFTIKVRKWPARRL